MTLKLRLIIVFSVLTATLFFFGLYAGSTIKYINNQHVVNQHISSMNTNILQVELNQLRYVYTGGREDANLVFDGLRSMYNNLNSNDHEEFTNEQHIEINTIKEHIEDYDKAFSQMISLSDQLVALTVNLEEDINQLNGYITLLSSNGVSQTKNVTELRKNLILFYTDYVTLKQSEEAFDHIDTSSLNEIEHIADDIMLDTTAELEYQVTGLRISKTIERIKENLKKYKAKSSELTLSSDALMTRTATIRESFSNIMTLQEDIITKEQTRVYVLTNILLAITISVFLSVIIYILNYTTKNLRNILTTTDKIADGHFEARLNDIKNDEFGQLGASINYMATSLEKSSRRQKDITSNLERMIADRTKELSDAKSALEISNKSLEKEKERLATMAVTDELTGLHNRRAALTFLQEQINFSMRYNHPLTIMEVDLDHFKEINDQFGHIAGDEVLRKLGGSIFNHSIRTIDFCARFGGEEFLFIFPETTIEDAAVLIERIQVNVKTTPFTFSNITMTFSAGVAKYNDETAIELIRKADEKLYQAKKSGRDCIIY